MHNGRITAARVIGATILTIVALAGSLWLAAHSLPIPSEFAIIAIAGVAGVVGIDVVAQLLAKKG